MTDVEKPDRDRIHRMVEAMRQALREFPEKFSVGELVSAQLTLFMATGKSIVEKQPDQGPILKRGIHAVLSELGLQEH